jgi:hypothetical protein
LTLRVSARRCSPGQKTIFSWDCRSLLQQSGPAVDDRTGIVALQNKIKTVPVVTDPSGAGGTTTPAAPPRLDGGGAFGASSSSSTPPPLHQQQRRVATYVPQTAAILSRLNSLETTPLRAIQTNLRHPADAPPPPPYHLKRLRPPRTTPRTAGRTQGKLYKSGTKKGMLKGTAANPPQGTVFITPSAVKWDDQKWSSSQ